MKAANILICIISLLAVGICASTVSSVQVSPPDGNGNFVYPNITFVSMSDGSYFWFDHSEANGGKAMLASILSAYQNKVEVDVYSVSNSRYFKSAMLTGPAWFKSYQVIQVGNEAKSISVK